MADDVLGAIVLGLREAFPCFEIDREAFYYKHPSIVVRDYLGRPLAKIRIKEGVVSVSGDAVTELADPAMFDKVVATVTGISEGWIRHYP